MLSLDKIKSQILPLWSVVMMLAGVAYFSYLVSMWSFKQESNDTNHDSEISALKIRVDKIETTTDQIHESLKGITTQINSIHILLARKEEYEHETID